MMAEEINNTQYRKDQLKHIIQQLHEGMSLDEARAKFASVFSQVSAEEISAAEQALIDEGLPVSEVQRLCEVHAAVFEDNIINPDSLLTERPGHPAHTLIAENAAMRELIRGLRALMDRTDGASLEQLRQGTARLKGIDSHYKIKENLLFPYLERAGVTGPPQVMWGVDDEIRNELKEAISALAHGDNSKLDPVFIRLEDMAFKEEQILLPMLIERLDEAAWRQVAQDTLDFGYFLISPPPAFPEVSAAARPAAAAQPAAYTPADSHVQLPTGDFSVEELTAVLNALPLDMTFVDKDNKVRFFSQGKERAFPRTISVLGRDVANCHPPASVHIVEQIVADLKSGKKEHEDFWIQMKGQLIMIRYFAVRSPGGEFLGVLETTQNIAPLKLIEGEKRLMS
ncbi:MAG: DUF438 domain-containing protein [Christensenellales bacterium]